MVRDAIIVVALSAACGITFNWLRGDGLPLVATREYQVFVPCPEPVGEVKGLDAAADFPGGGRALVVDARDAAGFGSWHYRGAVSVPYDYLAPVPDETVRTLAASGAPAVVVYGDGLDPDSGREMARELAGRGLVNVHWVRGGAPALKAKGR